jgi:hypothetical protein
MWYTSYKQIRRYAYSILGNIVVYIGSMVIAGEAKLKRLQGASQISEGRNSYRILL